MVIHEYTSPTALFSCFTRQPDKLISSYLGNDVNCTVKHMFNGFYVGQIEILSIL